MAGLLLLLLLAAACSSNTELTGESLAFTTSVPSPAIATAPPTAAPPPTTAPTVETASPEVSALVPTLVPAPSPVNSEDWPLLDLVLMLELSPENMVTGADFDLAASAFAFDRVDCDTSSADARNDELFRIVTQGRVDEPPTVQAPMPALWVRDPIEMIESGDWEASFGFRTCDVASFAEVSTVGNATVFATGASAVDVAAAVEGDARWSSDLQVITSGGQDYWWWGDGGDLTRVSPARPLGTGGAIAHLGDGVVARTPSMEAMEELIAGDSSVGADPDLVALVRQVGAAQPYTFGITIDPGGARTLLDPDGSKPDGVAQPLDPYRAIAWGVAFDGASHVLTVAILHHSDESALTNLDRIRSNLQTANALGGQPWSSILKERQASVSGEIVLLTLVPAEGNRLQSGLMESRVLRGDTPFAPFN